jgi:uncharacterized membrane protein
MQYAPAYRVSRAPPVSVTSHALEPLRELYEVRIATVLDQYRHMAYEAKQPTLAWAKRNARSLRERTQPLRDRLRNHFGWLFARPDELPPPLKGRAARFGWLVVTLGVAAFVFFFSRYLFALNDAYQTHAEDMGIMMQALWNTTHGAPLHQTICNVVSDTNCLGDVSRLAIHFEPIMAPLALLYALAPSAKTLQVAQALIVALGAFPAYALASRKLQSAFAGVVFAALYLLYPSLDAAVTDDFHAVALAAPLLMFALYFLLTRNNLGFAIAAGLAIMTKEEVALSIAMIGLYAIVMLRRRRLGAVVVALAIGWIIMETLLMRQISPIGHSPLTSRYDGLGDSPGEIALYLLTHPLTVVQRYLLDTSRVRYLAVLLAPVAFLALLSPTALVIGVPVIGLNLLSNNAVMYSGYAQYSVELTPIIVFAAIDGSDRARKVLTPAYSQARLRLAAWIEQRQRLWQEYASWLPRQTRALVLPSTLLLALTLTPLATSLAEQQRQAFLPIGRNYVWPVATAHTTLANEIIARIPASASVSAQSDLVPHLSNRRFVYLFPYRAVEADYVLLDVTSNPYPLSDAAAYVQNVWQTLNSGLFKVVVAQDGYILLQRGTVQEPGVVITSLPDSFFTYTHATPDMITNRTTGVAFKADAATIHLLGYSVSPTRQVYLNNPVLTVTTYWRITGTLTQAVHPEIVVTYPSGATFSSADSATTQWLPMDTWPNGATIAVQSWPMYLSGAESGNVRIGVRIAPTAQGDASEVPFLRARARYAPHAMQPRPTFEDGTPAASDVSISVDRTLVSFASETFIP